MRRDGHFGDILTSRALRPCAVWYVRRLWIEMIEYEFDIYLDAIDTPTAQRAHRITNGPAHAMTKRLCNVTSHMLLRGLVSAPDFAAVAQCCVTILTQFSMYVTTRHPLHTRIWP